MKHFLLVCLCCAGTSLFAQHGLVLKSGIKHSGQVVSFKDGMLTFLENGATVTFRAAEIKAIYFDESGNAATSSAQSSEEKTITVGVNTVKYKMKDRVLIKNPKIDNMTQEKGTVAVDIIVDKYGNVTKAEPGAAGSTTTSNYLFTKAKQAAESAKFDNQPTAPLQQKGIMTIVF